MKTKTNWFEAVWAIEDFLILDSETTGLGRDAEILQLGIINKAGEVLFDKLIQPWATWEWPGAQRVHGITPEMVADCLPIFDHEELFDLLHGKTVLVYNAPYDSRVFRQSLSLSNCKWYPEPLWIDVMEPYATHWGAWSSRHQSYTWQSLTNACLQQNIEIKGAHSAVGDCQMTLALIKKLAGVGL